MRESQVVVLDVGFQSALRNYIILVSHAYAVGVTLSLGR